MCDTDQCHPPTFYFKCCLCHLARQANILHAHNYLEGVLIVEIKRFGGSARAKWPMNQSFSRDTLEQLGNDTVFVGIDVFFGQQKKTFWKVKWPTYKCITCYFIPFTQFLLNIFQFTPSLTVFPGCSQLALAALFPSYIYLVISLTAAAQVFPWRCISALSCLTLVQTNTVSVFLWRPFDPVPALLRHLEALWDRCARSVPPSFLLTQLFLVASGYF